MDEDFIFQVTEEELAQFPEEEGKEKEQEERSKSPVELAQKKEGEENTLQKEKVNIPSLLDLKLPRLYATSRNGQCSRQDQKQDSRSWTGRRRQCRQYSSGRRMRRRCGQHSIHRIR